MESVCHSVCVQTNIARLLQRFCGSHLIIYLNSDFQIDTNIL